MDFSRLDDHGLAEAPSSFEGQITASAAGGSHRRYGDGSLVKTLAMSAAHLHAPFDVDGEMKQNVSLRRL